MGLSAARSLLKEGHSIRLFEQAHIPNEHGSSFDDHRLIRYPYGAQEGYMHMVSDAYDAWDRLWADLGAIHYTDTGTLVISKSHRGWAAESQATLASSSFALTPLSATQLTERYPELNTQDVVVSFYLESGGALFASRILASLKEYVVSKGAELHEQTRITAIDSRAGVVHTLKGDSFASDLIILTAGAWLPDLLPEFSKIACPSRQSTLYIQLSASSRERLQQLPMILDIDPSSGFYLVPPVSGLGLKIGDHRFSYEGHPNNRALPPETYQTLRAACHRLPVLSTYPIARTQVCFYTVAADEQFIGTRTQNTWVLTGFSGHGFKFGPLVGEQLAAVISKKKSEDAFSHWLAGELPKTKSS